MHTYILTSWYTISPSHLFPRPRLSCIRLVGPLAALLDDFPEQLDVDSAGDADALFAGGQQTCDCPARLRVFDLRILQRPFRDDADLKPLPPGRALGFRGIEVVERDLVTGPR